MEHCAKMDFKSFGANENISTKQINNITIYARQFNGQ